MQKKVGFLGCGNMNQAIIQGLVSSTLVKPEDILVFDHKNDTNQRLAREFNVTAMQDAERLAAQSDILIVGVKPHVICQALTDIAPHLNSNTVIVSIAAGISLASLQAVLPEKQKVIRAMPNTPCLIGQGMTSISGSSQITQQELNDVKAIFQSFGKAEQVPESVIHAVTGVSGSAPAYVYLLIEAMADGAVLGGMPRDQAYRFAAQTVKGAAEMVLNSGHSPAILKDRVCSPGGTTIEAISVLEKNNFRSAIIEAIRACIQKSEKMGSSK